jgi:hypothetical protein
MKSNYPVLYLLLFLIMIMGTLASMALNEYGMKLMGVGCAGFALVFLHELVTHLDRRPARLAELTIIILLSVLLACRNLFIEIPFGQRLSTGLFAVLAATYLYNGIQSMQTNWSKNRPAAAGLLFYYLGVSFLLIGFVLGLVNVSPFIGAGAGVLALMAAAVIHFTHRTLFLDGESVTLVQLAVRQKNKSLVVLIALLLTGMIFTPMQLGILPSLYSGDMPAGYTELIRRAESGLDPDAQTGEPRYRVFYREYEKFVKRRK